jgi:ribonuclease BN (tRNA processing enzyme)
VRVTVLGACGAWPEAGGACSGYLVEHDGFRLLLDAGYAVLPRLLAHLPAEDLDAVLITHGHPDHCADLNPLLRARALSDGADGPRPPALPVRAPHGALDAVLALDRPGMLDAALALGEFTPGAAFTLGPFDVTTRDLPHHVTNAGYRLTARRTGATLAYTGDSGPSEGVVALGRNAGALLAEATHVERVPDPDDAPFLTSARDAARQATRAGARRLVLHHLWPGTPPAAALAAAREHYAGPLDVARPGLVIEL